MQLRDDDDSDSSSSSGDDEDDSLKVVMNVNVNQDNVAQPEEAVAAPAQPNIWSFNLGDLQEHKYNKPEVWTEDGPTHAETEPIENVHDIVIGHFRPDHTPYEDDQGNTSKHKGDFMSAHAIHEEEDRAEHREMLEAYTRPYKPVPDQLVDDWTATRYGKYWYTYGEAPYPPYAEDLDERGFTKVKVPEPEEVDEADEDEEEEESLAMRRANKPRTASFLQLEPYDPGMADVDKIMQRYKDKDAEDELA